MPKRKAIKRSILNIAQFISSHHITRSIIDSYKRLVIKTKVEKWGTGHYLYIFFFIPLSILTFITLILMIEGQLFHLLEDTRCDINTFNTADKYCRSYFGLMLGVIIISIFQLYIYWHYITSLKSHLFSSNR
jgi:hypothetical protein